MIVDSLPDVFENIICQECLTAKGINKVIPLEQLAYAASRGIGALEYKPVKEFFNITNVNIDEFIIGLGKVLKLKEGSKGEDLNRLSLLNVFKIGLFVGGNRPEILI